MPYHAQQQGRTRKVTGELWRVMCLCPTLCARCALFFYPSSRLRTCQLELTVDLRSAAPGEPVGVQSINQGGEHYLNLVDASLVHFRHQGPAPAG